MKNTRRLSAALAVVGLALWLAPAALAQSSTLYPAGDTVSASSIPITMTFGTLSPTCTFNPGTLSIPTKGNSSGAETATFTGTPTFTGCSIGFKVETSGTWTISTQYGTGAATITIPAGGFIGNYGVQNIGESWTLVGVWNNGFTSPVNVSSSVDLYPTTDTYYSGGVEKKIAFGSAFSTLTDLTHPGSPLLLGP